MPFSEILLDTFKLLIYGPLPEGNGIHSDFGVDPVSGSMTFYLSAHFEKWADSYQICMDMSLENA